MSGIYHFDVNSKLFEGLFNRPTFSFSHKAIINVHSNDLTLVYNFMCFDFFRPFSLQGKIMTILNAHVTMRIDARGIYHFLKALTAQHFLQRKVAHRPLGSRDFVVLSGVCYWFPPRVMVICRCPWTSISTLPMGMLCVLEETAPPLFLALNSESGVSHHGLRVDPDWLKPVVKFDPLPGHKDWFSGWAHQQIHIKTMWRIHVFPRSVSWEGLEAMAPP